MHRDGVKVYKWGNKVGTAKELVEGTEYSIFLFHAFVNRKSKLDGKPIEEIGYYKRIYTAVSEKTKIEGYLGTVADCLGYAKVTVRNATLAGKPLNDYTMSVREEFIKKGR